MRRGAPELLIGVLLAILLSSYVVYTRRVVGDLRRESLRSSRMYARVFRAQSDTSEGAGTQALFDLSKSIVEQGVPLIVTDTSGRPTAHANLPPEVAISDSAMRAHVRELDRQNAPVVDSIAGEIHYGNTPLVRWLRIIPALQAATAFVLLMLAVFVVRARGNAEQERVWAGMARESAHQLGTPLSSLAGWIELLEEETSDAGTRSQALSHMRADLERLDRVAHRFERIGRVPRHDPVNLAALVERVASYFRARVPTLANAVIIDTVAAIEPVTVQADAVLLEWALEVLVKNAVDALAGRGGRITIAVQPDRQGAQLQVSDDGPGIPRELRGRIFEPGFSTKQRGWGIGLSLARRIVEENHGGSLRLLNTDRGATFEIIL